jgi:hypothetical protein
LRKGKGRENLSEFVFCLVLEYVRECLDLESARVR